MPVEIYGERFEEDRVALRFLHQADTEYVYRTEGLITLRPGRESALLDAFIERVLKMVRRKPIQVARQ